MFRIDPVWVGSVTRDHTLVNTVILTPTTRYAAVFVPELATNGDKQRAILTEKRALIGRLLDEVEGELQSIERAEAELNNQLPLPNIAPLINAEREAYGTF